MYWACARTEAQREAVAERHLSLGGYRVYLPRLRVQRRTAGRKVEVRPPLFPGYVFFAVEGGFHSARWTVGVLGLIMNGERPAAVGDDVIAALRGREVGGLIELPKPPKFRPGDRVRVLHGPLIGQVGLYAGMKPRARVEVLLAILGGRRRVALPADAVEAVAP